jgi:membrane dipeptidase
MLSPHRTIRHAVKRMLLGVAGAAAALLLQSCGTTAPQTPGSLEDEASALHREIISIDTHSDTPLRMMRKDFDAGKRQSQPGDDSKIDFPRMKEGGLDAVFFAAWVAQGPRTPEGNKEARDRVMTLIDSIHATVDRNPGLSELALRAADAARIKAEGKRAVYIGIENGYAVGNDLALVKAYYDRGVRYITLCHTLNNDICGSSSDSAAPGVGLSEFGKTVMHEMIRLGILVDVSHVSDSTFFDVMALSPVPVIASHSCTRALCANDRNMSDDMLRALAKNGGVVQVSLVGEFVKIPAPQLQRDSALDVFRAKYRSGENLTPETRQAMRKERLELNTRFPRVLPTVSDVVDHIDHVVNVAGIDHVGIGSDFDGGGGVSGCFDVSEMKNITIELLRRGYSHEQIRKIWGGNFLRVLRSAEDYAAAHRSL